jgi:predicted DNA-binding transcriptional regulator YafY
VCFVLLLKHVNFQLASNEVLSSLVYREKTVAGFFEPKRVKIDYMDEKSNHTQRQVDPNYLLLNWPVWYLLGWDYLRNDVRVFRLDRVQKIQVEDKTIVRRSNTLFLNVYEQYFKAI